MSLAAMTVSESTVYCNEFWPVFSFRWRRDVSTAVILTLISFLVYNANLRLVSAGDNYPARYLPFAILGYGSLGLDPVAKLVAQGRLDPYWTMEQDGHVYSKYPIAAPVLVTPLYVPAVAYLHCRGWTDHRLDQAARIMEKLTSALVASLSVGCMYLLLVRRALCQGAHWLTIAFGLGTNTWMISSQALWQHGVAELLLVVSLYIILGQCSATRTFWAGMLLGLIACARPPDAILAAALGLFGLRWAAGRSWLLVTGAAIPLALVAAYNYQVAHHLAGGYSLLGDLSKFCFSMPRGVLGLLFSPARGLFVFSPFLLFLPFCLRYTLREPRARTLAIHLLVAVTLQVLLYAKLDWRAGCAWGPRWLTEIVPLLVWMLAPGFEHIGRLGRAAFILATGMSIWAQVVGAFWYTGESDAVINQTKGALNRRQAVWDVRNTPFVAEFRHELAPRDLTITTIGNVDRIKVDGRDVDQITAGAVVEIEGWALSGKQAPINVQVTLAPTQNTVWHQRGQYPTAQTSSFLERPDVTSTMGGVGPAGWRVVLKTDGLRPGPYSVELRALGNNSESFLIAQRPFQVDSAPAPASGMSALYNLAKDRLRTQQNASGYWLTAHTITPRFDRPKFEMNTFNTSMIVDILAPVAKPAGLVENLERAQRHLLDQIESDGLVRYHGRPDLPTIPTLGCVITPDADDTALVWRITGLKGDPRLSSALDVLKSYRTEAGLYRTWLAPQAQYSSIDPGKDPNPADVGIQMHVLMFLARIDSPAAEALRRALQSAAAEQSIWVYYEIAPLVPILREADLHNLGYDVRLPQDRLQTSVPGQEVWVKACQQLARYVRKDGSRPSQAETRALLESLAKNDFEAMRCNPPLFFHNDQTARCSRYYWSEPCGYALWLRLYMESAIEPRAGIAAADAGR